MSLVICRQCQSAYLETESKCPHCISNRASVTLPVTLLLGLGLNACEEIKPDPDTTPLYGVEMVDNDGDGYEFGYDCDDEDALTHPGAAPLDSVEDCMTDADGDDYGDANPINEDVVAGSDCDDSDPEINPGADNCD